jgi:hypothetical protein
MPIGAFLPTQLCKPSNKGRDPTFGLRVIFAESHEHADASHPGGLLGLYGKRPSRHCASEKHDDIAALHGDTLRFTR